MHLASDCIQLYEDAGGCPNLAVDGRSSYDLYGTQGVKGTRQGLVNPSGVFAINRHHSGIRGDGYG